MSSAHTQSVMSVLTLKEFCALPVVYIALFLKTKK